MTLLIVAAAAWTGSAHSQSIAMNMRSVGGSALRQAAPDPMSDATSAIPARLHRQVVDYRSAEPPGTVIIDTPNTYLYFILGGGRAIRYGVGIGREGFTWSGVKAIERKTEWPDWIPPADMLHRQPYLPRFMAGGPGNPLGARAIDLAGTVYRIHGTNAPQTIGKQVSSGCIRMLNEDVIDLYDRTRIGGKVVVLPMSDRATSDRPLALTVARGAGIGGSRPLRLEPACFYGISQADRKHLPGNTCIVQAGGNQPAILVPSSRKSWNAAVAQPVEQRIRNSVAVVISYSVLSQQVLNCLKDFAQTPCPVPINNGPCCRVG
jgi:lipoprotein-anchoring transpeptidase ErfK/SrfK